MGRTTIPFDLSSYASFSRPSGLSRSQLRIPLTLNVQPLTLDEGPIVHPSQFMRHLRRGSLIEVVGQENGETTESHLAVYIPIPLKG